MQQQGRRWYVVSSAKSVFQNTLHRCSFFLVYTFFLQSQVWVVALNQAKTWTFSNALDSPLLTQQIILHNTYYACRPWLLLGQWLHQAEQVTKRVLQLCHLIRVGHSCLTNINTRCNWLPRIRYAGSIIAQTGAPVSMLMLILWEELTCQGTDTHGSTGLHAGPLPGYSLRCTMQPFSLSQDITLARQPHWADESNTHCRG